MTARMGPPIVDLPVDSWPEAFVVVVLAALVAAVVIAVVRAL